MIERLYYIDSHIHEFEAEVQSCTKDKKGWIITMDKTAFFPEGGGQLGDTGFIAEARVFDTQEKGGEVFHYADRELEAGRRVHCVLNYEQRLRRMQNHSGEHIVSGITHNLFGYNNVGFHMGEDFMTVDFDGELSKEQILRIETLANEVVRDNVRIKVWFPEPEELGKIDYRSKLELTHDVRIVDIEGVDICACCAPHVSYTGEIGLIKILEAERHRGGMRLSLICGMDALDNCRRIYDCNTAVSVLLSSRREKTAEAVERVLSERDSLKEHAALLSMELIKLKAESYEKTEGNICVFDNTLGEVALRELVNLLMERCTVAAAFTGSDEKGYRYIIGSKHLDLRKNSSLINAGIGGRGGGKSSMIMGSASEDQQKIKKYIEKLKTWLN